MSNDVNPLIGAAQTVWKSDIKTKYVKGMMESRKVIDSGESTHNYNYLIRRLGRVYSCIAPYTMDGLPPTDKYISALLNDEKVLSLFARRGYVTEGDLVTTISAIQWTVELMHTRKRLYMQPAIATEYGSPALHGYNTKNNPGIWNCCVLYNDRYVSGNFYNVPKEFKYSVPISIVVGEDLFDVSFKEG